MTIGMRGVSRAVVRGASPHRARATHRRAPPARRRHPARRAPRHRGRSAALPRNSPRSGVRYGDGAAAAGTRPGAGGSCRRRRRRRRGSRCAPRGRRVRARDGPGCGRGSPGAKRSTCASIRSTWPSCSARPVDAVARAVRVRPGGVLARGRARSGRPRSAGRAAGTVARGARSGRVGDRPRAAPARRRRRARCRRRAPPRRPRDRAVERPVDLDRCRPVARSARSARRYQPESASPAMRTRASGITSAITTWRGDRLAAGQADAASPARRADTIRSDRAPGPDRRRRDSRGGRPARRSAARRLRAGSASPTACPSRLR